MGEAQTSCRSGSPSAPAPAGTLSIQARARLHLQSSTRVSAEPEKEKFSNVPQEKQEGWERTEIQNLITFLFFMADAIRCFPLRVTTVIKAET